MSGRIAATLAVLVLLPVLVGPIAVGVVLERQVAAQLAGSPELPFELEYERGLYFSRARTRFSLADAAGDASLEGQALVVDHVIVHGPVPLAAPLVGRSPFGFAAMWVHSSLEVDAEALPNVARALDGAALVRLDTRVGFDRRLDLALEAPAFVLEDGRLTWKGLVGDATVEPLGGAGAGRIEMRGLELSDGETTLVVAPASGRFQLDLERRRLATVLDQQGLELVSPESRLAVGALHVESEAPLVGDAFGPSQGSARLTEISGGGGIGDAGFLIEGVAFAQRISLDDATGLYRGQADLGFERSRLGTRAPDGPGSVQVVIDRVDRAAVMRMRDALQALETSGAGPEQIESMRPFVVLEQLPSVLASSPSFDVRDLVYLAPEGRLEGALHVSVDGSQPEMLQDPFSILGQLEASARLGAPEALLRRLLAPWAVARAEQAAAADAGGDREPEPIHPVDAWLASGTLVREGDRLVLDARFERGLPMLNGRPADPALMLQLMPGM